jgi:hypothetical protein
LYKDYDFLGETRILCYEVINNYYANFLVSLHTLFHYFSRSFNWSYKDVCSFHMSRTLRQNKHTSRKFIHLKVSWKMLQARMEMFSQQHNFHKNSIFLKGENLKMKLDLSWYFFNIHSYFINLLTLISIPRHIIRFLMANFYDKK